MMVSRSCSEAVRLMRNGDLKALVLKDCDQV